MRIRIVALGQRMPAWVDAGFSDYARRLPRDYAVDLVELKPAARDRGRTVEQILEAEAERIEATVAGDRLIACDERGRAWTTHDFAGRLRGWHDEAQDVAFAIGSADGLSPRVRARADAVLSLSAFTLPHALVRVLLVEQVYRAVTLIGGHPYHRE
ncbi:MAG TPA: 23S rRNA (pseudouridine(1915)-N(3))-methyltransferase RlmH [Casimicrobiaceae bacterium]|jgi:23S rRNA (pseudouridine1915-N3)-methyltransferase